MKTPIDLYNDPGHATLQVLLERHPGAVPLLKQANVEDTREQIPFTAFAWPEQKMYPVHTPEQAITSYLYAAATAPKEVLASIEEALDAYGIPLNALAPVEVKLAALTENDCIFPENQAYPVRNAGEVKQAEEMLLTQVTKLLPENRLRAFTKLSSAAETHGVTLRPESYRWAGATATDVTALAATLDGRSLLAKEAEHKDAYLELARAVRTNSVSLRDINLRAKLAGRIAQLDKTAGLLPHYDRQIPDPVATVFNTTVKTASDDIDLNGSMVSRSALSALPSTFFADALGKDIVPEITTGRSVDLDKLAMVLTTLPADMKSSFARNLRAAGVPVV